MARPGKNGGVYLNTKEIIDLVAGMRECKNDSISRLGIPLEAHVDYLVYDLAQKHNIQYWGSGKPFENSAHADHFHWDNRGANVESQRIGTSFYPNLRDLKQEAEDAKLAAQNPDHTSKNKGGLSASRPRPTIACKIHGRSEVITHSLDMTKMSQNEIDTLLSASLLKVHDADTGSVRNLRVDDLELKVFNNKRGGSWSGFYLKSDIEFDKNSVDHIRQHYGMDTLSQRIDNQNKRFKNTLGFTKPRSQAFQKEFAQGLETALMHQALYEKVNPRNQENSRFSERKSNYVNRATKDTLHYGIGNIRNIWQDLYHKGSLMMVADLNDNEPLGRFFIETIEKGYDNSEGDKKKIDPKQALDNLKTNLGDFLIYEKIDENDQVSKVVQRIGSYNANYGASPQKSEKKFLAGGGGFDSHYIEVLGGVSPDADIKPPQNIFILEGIKTAVDFAAALDIKEQTDNHNTHVVLSAGSAANVINLATAMGAKYEDAMIAVIADNDVGNTLKGSNLKNSGVETSIEAVNAVAIKRREAGVHPNATFIIPPAIGNRNTDIADLREHFMSNAGEKIRQAMDAKNMVGGNLGVNVNDDMQKRAREYAAHVFTNGYAKTVVDMVNNSLQAAKDRNEIIHAPVYEVAKLEPVRNIDSYRPLPQTFGKPRSQANPENAAIKARILANANEMYENAPDHLKGISSSMWSYLGCNQRFDNDGDMVALSKITAPIRVANIAQLITETLDNKHPLHNAVKQTLIGAYKQNDQNHYIDFKKSNYGRLAMTHEASSSILSKVASTQQTADMQKSIMKAVPITAIAALSTDTTVSKNAYQLFHINQDPNPSGRQVTTPHSMSLITMASLVAIDISDSSILPDKTERSRAKVRVQAYTAIMDNMIAEVEKVDSSSLNAVLKNGETKQQLLGALSFAKDYGNLYNKSNLLQHGMAPNPNATPEDKAHFNEIKNAHTKFEDRVKLSIFAGAKGDGGAIHFWDEVREMFPKAANTIGAFAPSGDDDCDYRDDNLLLRYGNPHSGLYKTTTADIPPAIMTADEKRYYVGIQNYIQNNDLYTRDVKALSQARDNNMSSEAEHTSRNNTSLENNDHKPNPAPRRPAVDDDMSPSGP